MAQSIPRALTQQHVLRALADLDAGFSHSFGEPTKFELVHKGKRYAPKAVIGLACRHLLGHVHYEFSGGEGPGQANYVLRGLGFTVVRKGEQMDEKDVLTGKDWTPTEVALAVGDYFDMLRMELLALPYSKAEHRRALQPLLAGRSNSSIEFKHQNISAVLVGLGLPYIDGYKPKGNFQGLLADAVDTFLAKRGGYLEQLAGAPLVMPNGPPANLSDDLEDLIVAPPERIVAAAEHKKPWLTMKPRRIDFVEQDAANRKLGSMGEEFVVELERRRLRELGRDELARKVDRVSVSIGDGLGFDVLSFDEADELKRYIEVKTTGLPMHFPFYVTANEVRCSEDTAKQYHLYRVFDFSRSPRVFILAGSLRETCILEPTGFVATY